MGDLVNISHASLHFIKDSGLITNSFVTILKFFKRGERVEILFPLPTFSLSLVGGWQGGRDGSGGEDAGGTALGG